MAVAPELEPSASQTFRERVPSPWLRRYITCVWVQEILPGSPPYTHRTVPNGGAEIVCELGGMAQIVGPQAGPTADVLPPGTTVVGVRISLGSAPTVLGVPASALVDLVVSADELWDASAVELSERIAGAQSPSAAAALLEAAVAARLVQKPELDPVASETVRQILSGRMDGVRSLALSMHISERQLRRRCEAAIGVTPKVLERMVRFQGFLALAGKSDHPTSELGRLALEAGYADQAHLTRESRRLAGRSPLTVLLEAQRHCGAAHDHAASYEPMLRGALHRSAWRRRLRATGGPRRRA
jgi:AraC-like DNA-binding protein